MHLPFSPPAIPTSYQRPVILWRMGVWLLRDQGSPIHSAPLSQSLFVKPADGWMLMILLCWCLSASWCEGPLLWAVVAPRRWLSHGEREQHDWCLGKAELTDTWMAETAALRFTSLQLFHARTTNKTNASIAWLQPAGFSKTHGSCRLCVHSYA